MYSNINAYKDTKVKTASQGQVIVMLYDEAIRQLDNAIVFMNAETRELDKINNSILKARDVITELMVSLDMEQGGEFAKRMFALYHWFNQQLLEANFRKETGTLETVKGFMIELRDAWAQIAGTVHVEGRVPSGMNIAG